MGQARIFLQFFYSGFPNRESLENQLSPVAQLATLFPLWAGIQTALHLVAVCTPNALALESCGPIDVYGSRVAVWGFPGTAARMAAAIAAALFPLWF